VVRVQTKNEDRTRLAWCRSIAALVWAIGTLLSGCGGGGGDGLGDAEGPGITIVFQTTFDCPDWIQGMGGADADVCSTGDGISGHGDWISSLGSRDQITAAANNPSGAGGKGLRHWRGDGQNNGGGGLSITLPAPVTEMWVRLYMRYSLGFAWTGGAPLYTKDNYWGACGSGCVIFGIQGNHAWGVNYNGDVNYSSSLSWSQSQGGNTGDGQWHLYEYHLKQDGSAATIEIWVDGVRYLNLTNADLGSTPWRNFKLGENQATATGCNPDCYTDYDDVAISTSGYIGPL
jgi:hypothetical protein